MFLEPHQLEIKNCFEKKKTENRRQLFKFSIKSVIRKFNVGVKAVAANINVLYYELHVPSYYISL